MSKLIKFELGYSFRTRSKVAIRSTEEPVSATEALERIEAGHFRLVLEGSKELDIDGLEQALLQVNYPALRDALSSHLTAVAKKKPNSTVS